MATWGVGPPGRHTEADASPFISPSMAKRSDDFPAATRPQTATNSPGMGSIFVPKATDGLAMGPWLAHFVMLSSPTKSFCTAFGNLRLALGTDQSSGGCWWHCVKSCHGCEEFSELSRCLDPCCRHAGPLDRCQNLLGTSHGARCKEDTGNCVTIWAWEQNDDGKSLQSFAKDTFTYFCQGLLRLQCSPYTFIALKITSVSFNFEKTETLPKTTEKIQQLSISIWETTRRKGIQSPEGRKAIDHGRETHGHPTQRCTDNAHCGEDEEDPLSR